MIIKKDLPFTLSAHFAWQYGDFSPSNQKKSMKQGKEAYTSLT